MRNPVRLFTILPILLGGLIAFKVLDMAGVVSGLALPAEAAEPEKNTSDAAPADAPELSAPDDDKVEIERTACDASAAIAAASGLSQAEVRVLQSLSGRRAEIEQMEQELDTREKLLAAAEGKIDNRVAELEAMRKEIEIMLNLSDEKKHEQILKLVGIYEKMKPKDSARIFEELDEDLAVRVAAGMKAQAVAAMLASMTPEQARRLTTLLASQTPMISPKELQDRLG